MTDQAISPLRRRMIEDMAIGKLALSRHGQIGGGTRLSTASRVERRRHTKNQCHGLSAAVLFQCDA
jgi:hypothetical protein